MTGPTPQPPRPEKRPWIIGGPALTVMGLGSVLTLRGIDDAARHPYALQVGSALLGVSLLWIAALLVDYARRPKLPEKPPQLDRQIISRALFWMVENSAWGRWHRMFNLAKNDQEQTELQMMWVARSVLEDAAQEGKITLWGVPTNGAGFEVISPELLQTRGALHLERDTRQSWRVVLGPYSNASQAVIDALPKYDWLAVDMNEIKRVWPERDKFTDAKTAELEREFKRRAGR